MKAHSLITYDRPNPTKQNNRIHRLVYNTRRWRDLRKSFLAINPLCAKCQEEGIIKLAEHVHHKTEISEAMTDSEAVRIGFDFNNLEGICRKHHTEEHNNRRANR
jgi:5-methylcytosine-specific restriction enzyme A